MLGEIIILIWGELMVSLPGIEDIRNSLAIWNVLKEGYKLVNKIMPYSKKVRRFESVEELSRAFFNEEISVGTRVEVLGILSRFQHCYLPTTQNPLIAQEITGPKKLSKQELSHYALTNATEINIMIPKGTGFRYLPDLMGLDGEDRVKVVLKQPYLPASSIPPIHLGKGEYITVYYLYPPDNKGLNSLTAFSQEGSDFYVPNNARGIPILFKNPGMPRQQEENFVKVSGIITEAPTQLLSVLDGLPEKMRNQINSLFYSPFSLGARSFCILGEELEVDDCLLEQDRVMRFYAEGHLEGVSEGVTNLWDSMDIFDDVFKEIAAGRSIANHRIEDRKLCSFTLGEIFVSMKEPSHIGFYIDCPMPLGYTDCISKLKHAFTLFGGNTQDILKKEYKIETALKLDFLFDFSLQKEFQSESVLSSKEALEASKDPALNVVRQWLRGEL